MMGTTDAVTSLFFIMATGFFIWAGLYYLAVPSGLLFLFIQMHILIVHLYTPKFVFPMKYKVEEESQEENV